jgi:non-homologous end joining protein Ku
MAERGQRTRIIFGGVSAEVSLFKTDGAPKEAKHETRRVVGPEAGQGRGVIVPVPDEALPDPFADRVAADPGPDAPTPDEATLAEYLSDAPSEALGHVEAAVVSAAPVEPLEPLRPTKVEQGVTRPDGTWVDLTERLAEIDERTKLDGMEVIATIASSSVPRVRVRNALYVGSANASAPKVMALLYHGLRETDRAAVVRRTVKTAQQLGIIVAQAHPKALVLLEVVWADWMREPGVNVTQPLEAPTSFGERDAAVALMRSFGASPSALNDLRDTRVAARAELLTLAREGKASEFKAPPPREVSPDVDDLAAALTAAAR